MLKHRGFILWLCVIAAVIMTGCVSRAVTPVPNTPAVIATNTPAPTASLTVTVTRTPQPTSTFTETPTTGPTWDPNATNTPMVPTQVSGQGYRLTEWTPEKAEQLVAFLKHYPDTVMYSFDEDIHNNAFRFAGLAEMESAYRFPQADEARKWQWDGAFDLYRSGDRSVEELYVNLLAYALNNKETSLENLAMWIQKVSPVWEVKVFPVTPPPSYQLSTIIYFEAKAHTDASGGFSIWLLKRAGVYTGYVLPNEYIIPSRYVASQPDTVDITGDGIEEVVLHHVHWASFGFTSGNITIYRLDQVPPKALTFDTPLYNPENAEWFVVPGKPVPTLTFRVPVSVWSDYNCYFYQVDWQYHWEQDQLKFLQIVAPPLKKLEEYTHCSWILASALQRPEYLKNASVMDLYKRLLELPYIETPDMTGIPPFSVEKARLELAIFLKSQGDEAGANEQIELIRASSDMQLAQWREDALAYYAVHDNPQELFNFCIVSKTCKTFLDIDEIIGLVPADQFDQVAQVLEQMGIDSKDSGSYDFDEDGTPEKWLFLLGDYPCGGETEFWILAPVFNEIKSRPVPNFCLREEDSIKGEVAIQPVRLPDDRQVYQLTVDGIEGSLTPFTFWPFDQENPTIFVQEAKQLIDSVETKLLLSQITPTAAQNQIIAIRQSPLDPYFWESESPAQLLYLLGLTYELNGQRQQAVETYLELWQTYPDSPYAYMAWAKLEPQN